MKNIIINNEKPSTCGKNVFFFMYDASTRPHAMPKSITCAWHINLTFDPQDPHVSEHPVAMEYLSVNEQWGQGYGYVLYRTLIPADSTKITVQGVKDYGLVGYYMMSYDVWCYMMSHGVTWCYMTLQMSHDVTWYYMVSHGVTWCYMVLHGASLGHGRLQTSKEAVLLWERDVFAAKDHKTGVYVPFWFHVWSGMHVFNPLRNQCWISMAVHRWFWIY